VTVPDVNEQLAHERADAPAESTGDAPAFRPTFTPIDGK
jgi:hypothetical protein